MNAQAHRRTRVRLRAALVILGCGPLASLPSAARADTPTSASPAAATAATTAASGSTLAPSAALAGLWDATVEVGTLHVPFRFGIAIDRDRVSGWFYNGASRVLSTSGALSGTHLVLEFASYGRQLDLTIGADGHLTGRYAPSTRGSSAESYRFQAERATRVPAPSSAAAPAIGGLWLVPTSSHKSGEQAWRLIVHQAGARVSAAILRVDGDTGALTGVWQDDRLVLSHFDGARPALLEVTAAADRTLHLRLRNAFGEDQTLIAYRPEDARARGLPEAADPMRHTRVRDPAAPFQFDFPDLRGHRIASTDARFRGKVLVIDIAGSWCPNCHDEAPLLETLYRKYRGQGLEVVTLAFEEEEQLADPVRLRAFVKDFGLDYTVLLAGTPQELQQKVPQAVDLDAYPTTFFVGRDGRVRRVHAGFAAPATGDFNRRLRAEFSATIEQLLAEKG